MAVSYQEVDPATYEIIHHAMKDYHSELVTASVTIHAIFASNFDAEDEPLPAVKFHGHSAAAKIQVTSLQDRSRGLPDVKLTIDRHQWDGMAKTRRIALVDHELEHLVLQTDDEGVKLDELGRPKLKLKIHDWMLAGFASIISRHGEAAVEHHEMVRWQEEYGQFCLFPLVKKDDANGR